VAGQEGLTVFAVNRSLQERLELTAELRALGTLDVEEWTLLRDDDLKRTNTAERPDAVVPRAGEGARVEGGALRALLEPASWNVIRLTEPA
jgi:alpha-N-arabinofuranosidase